MKGGYSRKSVLTGITSFLIVLFTMPLGHALMILWSMCSHPQALHYAAFTMGAVGLVMVILLECLQRRYDRHYEGYSEDYSSGPDG